jgi:hypothetical protein
LGRTVFGDSCTRKERKPTAVKVLFYVSNGKRATLLLDTVRVLHKKMQRVADLAKMVTGTSGQDLRAYVCTLYLKLIQSICGSQFLPTLVRKKAQAIGMPLKAGFSRPSRANDGFSIGSQQRVEDAR